MKTIYPLSLAASLRACVRCRTAAALLLVLFINLAQAAPLPTFSDANLQACFDEQAVANNWVEAEDVDALLCADKRIEHPDGLYQLPNLTYLDLSHNPIVDLPPLFELSQTLQKLDVSGIQMFDLSAIIGLQRLTQLRLNDVMFTDPNVDASLIEQQLLDVVRDNLDLTHLGINGMQLNDLGSVLNELCQTSCAQIISLELSNTGLAAFPLPLEQFSSLQVLDISENRVDWIGPLFAQQETLEQLNLSGNPLYDLSALMELNALTHLTLNDIDFSNTDIDAAQLEQQLLDVVRNNPNITHFGINGINISDPLPLFNELSTNLVSLELSRTGLTDLPLPLDQYSQLAVLDLSQTAIPYIPPLPAESLRHLNLSGMALYDLFSLQSLDRLTHLMLNDVEIMDPNADPLQLEQLLLDAVRANTSLTYLGASGITLSDPAALFNALPRELTGLELSNTGLEYVPLAWEEFSSLQVIDLSDNPQLDVPPFYVLAQTLKRVDISNTAPYDLGVVIELQGLTHLRVNNVSFSGLGADPLLIEEQLLDVVRSNPGLTHLGINGIQLSDPALLFNELSLEMDSLELGNTGLQIAPVPLDQYRKLEYLDLKDNGITDIFWLIQDFQSLKTLDLSQNDGIACSDLQVLVEHLGSEVTLIKPQCSTPAPTYCDAKGNNQYYEWIAGVTLADQTHASSSDNGYGDFTGVNFTVPTGETTAISLTPGFRSSSYQEYWSVWIDINRDGVFEESEKLVRQSSNTVVSRKLFIPTEYAGTTTRMRVAMRWGGEALSCGNFTYGEVEDYTVTFVD